MFSSWTTAVQAVGKSDLSGKTIVLTGGNSGIGVETARALALAGARVILTSRNVSSGEAVAADIRSAGIKGSVEVQQLDLADLSSVKNLALKLQSEANIDTLILNAGVAWGPLRYTKDNFEMQVGTNHFGHFALVQSLLPKLRQQESPVRVVVVASIVHQFGGLDVNDLNFRHRRYFAPLAYQQSKLCNMLFTKELASRLQGSNIEVFAVHPGMIDSGLSRHMAWPVRFAISYLSYFFLKSAAQGAATSVYAATAPELAGKSGAYLSNCKIARPSAQAQDADLAKRLWAVTEEQLQDPAART